MPPKLGPGDKTMPLPEEVHLRLAARAVTDPDVASLLAIFTKTNDTVSEPPLDHVIENAETPKLLGEPVDLLYYTLRSNDQRTDCGYDAGRNPAALSESLGLLDCQTFRLNY
jgi:hypothetical protein